MSPSLKLVVAAVFCALALPSLAQVHKCKGADGKVRYSDMPCAADASGGRINVRPNTIDTSIDRARTERRIQQRQLESAQQQTAPAPLPPQQSARRSADSYECRMAIRNAGIHGSRATPKEIDDARAKAISICGYNPWPGKTMVEIDAENRRTRAIERSRPNPNDICDHAGGFARCD